MTQPIATILAGLYAQGVKLTDMPRIVGMPLHRVRKVLYGDDRTDGVIKPSRNRQIMASERREIARLAGEGYSQCAIGARVGRAQGVVSLALRQMRLQAAEEAAQGGLEANPVVGGGGR